MIDITKAILIFMISFIGGALSLFLAKISEWKKLTNPQRVIVIVILFLIIYMCIQMSNFDVIENENPICNNTSYN